MDQACHPVAADYFIYRQTAGGQLSAVDLRVVCRAYRYLYDTFRLRQSLKHQ